MSIVAILKSEWWKFWILSVESYKGHFHSRMNCQGRAATDCVARAIVRNRKSWLRMSGRNLDPDNSWEISWIFGAVNLQGTTVFIDGDPNSQISHALRHRVTSRKWSCSAWWRKEVQIRWLRRFFRHLVNRVLKRKRNGWDDDRSSRTRYDYP